MTYFPAPGYMPAYNPGLILSRGPSRRSWFDSADTQHTGCVVAWLKSHSCVLQSCRWFGSKFSVFQTLPYHQPVPGGLHPGMSVYVQGTVPKHTKRFRVNFACGQHEGGDIPFHFNPRFDGKDKTVLNTFQSGRWGNEEIHKMPFQKGEHFEIIFIVNDVGYQGMMPNPGYGPPQNLPMMQSPAVYHPPVPYTGNISGGLGAKRTIIVRGSIPMNFNRFHINLKAGQDIALHINPRGQEQIVLSIRCGNHRFKVYVNGQPFFNYAHRYRNFPQIDTLQIDGDVVLSYIQC
ncbi:hypothetical protein E2320_000810 [Naja naja]|nr:hypothetical protein E2320_000810 [Naja naja]